MGRSWLAVGVIGAFENRFLKMLVFLVLAASLAWMNMGCASTWAERYPQARVYRVCARPMSLESDARGWVYSNTNEAISSAKEEQFDEAARTSRRLFRYDPDADLNSVMDLPTPDDRMVCPDRYRPLPEKEDREASLPDESLFFADRDERCRRFHEENDPRKGAMYLGQAPPKRAITGGCMAPGPLTVREQALRAARSQAQDIGKRFGSTLGYYEGWLKELFPMSNGLGLSVYITRDPSFLLDVHKTISDAINQIPELPTYEDPEFAQAALAAFEGGYGDGIAEARLRALTVSAGFELLYIAAGNLGALAENAGIKTLQAALTRVRSMPIFIPGTTSGVGFFLRVPKTLPKPPPGNVNAPSLPVGVVPPPGSVPLPFGNLSRAAEFGIKPYNQLIKAVQGTGLEGHHLIEQRFINVMGTDPRMKLTVAVTNAEHQAFTNEWRNQIAYGNAGTHSAPPDKVLEAARHVYKDYPAILKALGL